MQSMDLALLEAVEANEIDPDDAFRFAKGEVLTGHNGMKVKLRRPLDFLVVTDHAEYLGVLPGLAAGDPALLATEAGARWAKGLATDPADAAEAFGSMGSRAAPSGTSSCGSPAAASAGTSAHERLVDAGKSKK